MIKRRLSAERTNCESGGVSALNTFLDGVSGDDISSAPDPLMQVSERRIPPGESFDYQSDEKKEIIYYVIAGELNHEDDSGSASVTVSGEVQVTSTGTGLKHREFNNSSDSETHYLKIELSPYFDKYTPSVTQKIFDEKELSNAFRVVTSTYAEYGSLIVRQRAKTFLGKFTEGNETVFETNYNQRYWLQVVKGDVVVNGEAATAGDGLFITDEEKIQLNSKTASEVLLFELQIE